MKIEIKKHNDKLVLIYKRVDNVVWAYTFSRAKGKELKQFEGLEMTPEIKKWCSDNDYYSKGFK